MSAVLIWAPPGIWGSRTDPPSQSRPGTGLARDRHRHLRRVDHTFPQRGAGRAVRHQLPRHPPGERKARLLLEVLRDRQADVLRFAHDLKVPPTSNQAERDLRPSKVQQKISGRLTSENRTRDRYTIRGYVSTAAKHGLNTITVLVVAHVLEGVGVVVGAPVGSLTEEVELASGEGFTRSRMVCMATPPHLATPDQPWMNPRGSSHSRLSHFLPNRTRGPPRWRRVPNRPRSPHRQRRRHGSARTAGP